MLPLSLVCLIDRFAVMPWSWSVRSLFAYGCHCYLVRRALHFLLPKLQSLPLLTFGIKSLQTAFASRSEGSGPEQLFLAGSSCRSLVAAGERIHFSNYSFEKASLCLLLRPSCLSLFTNGS